MTQDTGFPIVWLVLVAIFIVCAVISFSVVMEDAFISFRYAENIAAGFGPVFNRYGPQVEGFSDPLWVGLLAIARLLGFSVIAAARYMGLFFGAMVLLEFILLFRLTAPGRNFGATAALVVATMPAFVFWSPAGLENALYIWLLFSSVRLAILEVRDPGRFEFSTLTLFLLAVTRPEGIMFFLIIATWRFLESWKYRERFTWGRTWGWFIAVLVLYGLFLVWRHQVFGEWVANTFFAKVNNGMRHNLRVGALYLLSCMNHTLWLPLLVPGFLAYVYRSSIRGQARTILKAILPLALIQIVFILYVGGDIHPVDRFFLPVYLLSIAISFLLLPEFKKVAFRKNGSMWLAVVLLIGNLTYSFPPSTGIEPPMSRPPSMLAANLAGLISGRLKPIDVVNRFKSPPADAFELVGRDLAANPEVGPVIAADQCGKIPYWSGLETIDLLGLNDRGIARIMHSVSPWGVYATEVLNRMPDTFILAYRNKRLISRYYLENTVLSEPFRTRYVLDATYRAEYRMYDIAGIEHSFSLELVRFKLISHGSKSLLSDDEIRWFDDHQPVTENPGALSDMVETFRAQHAGDADRVITYSVPMN